MKTTIEKINEMELAISGLLTSKTEDRQMVANLSKELYSLIEEDVYKAGKEWMLKGMYKDLCTGNFAEPFMCEQKKSGFITIATIYKDRVANCI